MIPQGTRFRLPASYDVNQITDPFARMMATAMRDYGLITTDTSGGVVVAGKTKRREEKRRGYERRGEERKNKTKKEREIGE